MANLPLALIQVLNSKQLINEILLFLFLKETDEISIGIAKRIKRIFINEIISIKSKGG